MPPRPLPCGRRLGRGRHRTDRLPGPGADAGRSEVYAAPGVGYRELRVPEGCHTCERSRTIGFADAEPTATCYFCSGPDCTGHVVGAGRDDSRWMPALDNVNPVRIGFE
ncbi:hypothetical protein ACFQZ2_21525 [Streptomonospora algeriensis]|uniref:Uncharacterized protein n=1 Tax=Streptomonospora algeriensis TaxID=995084 RepID=A0ABW3BLH5_9ACTN